MPVNLDLGDIDFKIEDGYITLQSDPNAQTFETLFESFDSSFIPPAPENFVERVLDDFGDTLMTSKVGVNMC